MWHTAQLFLSPEGIAEVEVDKGSKYRCNCPQRRRPCRHIRFVYDRASANGGFYSMQLQGEIDPDEWLLASDDPERFRRLVLKHGSIEVL